MIKLINIALELFVKDIFTFRTFLTRRQNCLNFMSLNTSSFYHTNTTPIHSQPKTISHILDQKCHLNQSVKPDSFLNLANENEDFLRVDLLFFMFYDMRWIIQGLSVFPISI